MGRPTKDSVKVSYTLDRSIAERLEEFCRDTGRTKTKVMELALEAYIRKHEKESRDSI